MSSGSKPSRRATSSLDGRVPSANSARRISPVPRLRHQSSPTSRRRRVLSWAERMKFDLSAMPNLLAYQARVAARPKVQEALTKEGLLKAA